MEGEFPAISHCQLFFKNNKYYKILQILQILRLRNIKHQIIVGINIFGRTILLFIKNILLLS